MSSSTSHNHNHKHHHLHHHNTTSNLMWEAQKEKSSFEVGSEREKMGRLILCSSLITLSSREIFPLLNFSADQCFISIYTKQITFRNFISLFVCWNIWQTFKPLHIPLHLWSLQSPCLHCHCLLCHHCHCLSRSCHPLNIFAAARPSSHTLASTKTRW